MVYRAGSRPGAVYALCPHAYLDSVGRIGRLAANDILFRRFVRVSVPHALSVLEKLALRFMVPTDGKSPVGNLSSRNPDRIFLVSLATLRIPYDRSEGYPFFLQKLSTVQIMRIVIRNPSDKISWNGTNGQNSVRQVKRARQ